MTSAFVVIVNYRTGPLVVECLASLVGELGALRGGRVIVVDNASGDDSVGCIAAAIRANGWGGWAEVLALPRNGGFAYGNNHAIQRAREHDPQLGTIVCLNPDTTVHAGAIAALIGHLDRTPQAGIAGASIEDEHGVLQRSAHPFHSPLAELDSGAQLGVITSLIGARSLSKGATDELQPSDWVSGACFAVRAEVFNAIGLFDEGYFLYFEETDFCLRAKRAGWSCWYVPSARVRHVEGASTGIREATRRRPAYWFASRRRFFVKAHGMLGLLVADLLWSAGRASFVLRRALGLGGAPKLNAEPRRFAFDLLTGDLKAMLSGDLRKGNLVNRSSA